MGNAAKLPEMDQAAVGADLLQGGKAPRTAEGGQKSLRLNLTLPPASAERLERLRTVTESSSSAEVIRKALRWFAYLVDEQEAGNTVQIEKENGDIVIVKMF